MKNIYNMFILIFTIVIVLFVSACNSKIKGDTNIKNNEKLNGSSNVLVVYFSWSGQQNTKKMAEYISDYTNGEIFRIIPKTPYTTNYNEMLKKADEEKKNNYRPELLENLTKEELDNYDTIFIGYPIWWYDAPMIIYSFLESHDFSDKTIIPFATSGGSGLQEEDKIRKISNANVLSGLCIRNISSNSAINDIKEWLESYKLLVKEEGK